MELEISKQKPEDTQAGHDRAVVTCRHKKVVYENMAYEPQIKHDGKLHKFCIRSIDIPKCSTCDQLIFNNEVDRRIMCEFRNHLGLLHPHEIKTGVKQSGKTQKECCEILGFAEETLSRWINETQIQSKSSDKLLRLFFIEEVRNSYM